MAEFLSHVGDYNDMGYQRGVSVSLRKITSRADKGKTPGTFVDASIPNKSYLHAREGVVIQRDDTVNPGRSTAGYDIPFNAFGFHDLQVVEAFGYPNRFEIIQPADARWAKYDTYFQDVALMGPDEIVEPGFYRFALNIQIPSDVDVRWYSEGGAFEADRADEQSMGFVISEDYWIRKGADDEEATIYCEISVPELGAKTVLKKVVLKKHYAKDALRDIVPRLTVLYPYKDFRPDVNNLAILAAYQSSSLLENHATVIRWTVDSVEKQVILYSSVEHSSTVNLILDDLYDRNAPNTGPIPVTITMDVVCGDSILGSSSETRYLIKPTKIEPRPPEIPPVARISSSVDLDYIRVSEGYFDLNADQSTTADYTEYWYQWTVSSAERPPYVIESTERNILVQLRDIVDLNAFGDVPLEIKLRIKSISNPKFISIATRDALVVRPATPEIDPIARITTVPADVSNVDPKVTTEITVMGSTSQTDSRYQYDIIWTLGGDYGDVTYRTDNKVQSFVTPSKDLIDIDWYDDVQVPIELKMQSLNDPRKNDIGRQIIQFRRPTEPFPVAKITTAPADLVANGVPITHTDPIEFFSTTSTTAHNIDYQYRWEITTSEGTVTSTEPHVSVRVSELAELDGIDNLPATAKLTITSMRTPALTSTTTINFTIIRPEELDPVAEITCIQDLHDINVDKISYIDLSSTHSTLDDRTSYTYSWTVQATGKKPFISSEVNPSVAITDFVEIEGVNSFDDIAGTVTLLIVSNHNPAKRSSHALDMQIKRRPETAPVVVITPDRDLSLVGYEDGPFELSPLKSEIDDRLEYTDYEYTWDIFVGEDIVHTTHDMVANIHPEDIKSNMAPLEAVDFTARLTMVSPNHVLKDTEIVLGTVTRFALRDFTPIFGGKHNPKIKFIQIPHWTTPDGTFSFNIFKEFIESVGDKQKIVTFKVDNAPVTISVQGLNLEEYKLIVEGTDKVTVNGTAVTANTKLVSNITHTISVSGAISIDKLFGSEDTELYSFVGQLTNFRLSTPLDERNYTLIEEMGSSAGGDLVVLDHHSSEGDTTGLITPVGGSTFPYWEPKIADGERHRPFLFAGRAAGFASMSTNNGLDWLEMTKGLESGGVTTITASAATGDTIIVVMEQGYAAISKDKGRNWAAMNRWLDSGATANNIHSVSAYNDLIFAGLDDGRASISRDKGVTWTALPKGLNSGSLTANIRSSVILGETIVVGMLAGFGAISHDSGATWEAVPKGFGTGDTFLASWCMATTGNNIIVGHDAGNASLSKDRGVTWTALPKGLHTSADPATHIEDIYALEVSGNVVVAGFQKGLAAISYDAGETWKALPRYLGMKVTSEADIDSLTSTGNIFVAGFSDGNAAISHDKGKTWTALEKGLGVEGGTTQPVTALSFVPKPFAPLPDLPVTEPVIFGLERGVAKRSQQGKEQWPSMFQTLPVGLNSGAGTTVTDSVGVICRSGDTYVASVGAGYASISQDKGATWTRLPRGLNCGKEDATCTCMAASGSTFIAGFTEGYASISSNGGLTWYKLPATPGQQRVLAHISAITASDDTFIIGYEGGHASLSQDKGKTWTKLNQGLNCGSTTSDLRSLAAYGNSVVAGFEDGYASLSTDRGLTWVPLVQGLNSGGTTTITSLVANAEGVFVAGMKDGYAAISFNKGVSWSAKPKGLNSGSPTATIDSLVAYSKTFIAGTNDGHMSISRDQGANWKATPRVSETAINTIAAEALPITPPSLIAIMNDGYASTAATGSIKESWKALSRGLYPGATTHAYTAISSSDDTVVAVGLAGYCAISENRGRTWRQLPDNLGSGGSNATSIAVNKDTFVVGFAQGYAALSIDKGQTWTRLPKGLNSGCADGDGILCLANYEDTFVAGFEQGYAAISSDRGRTWRALPQWLNSGGSTINHQVKSLAASEGVFVAGFGDGYAAISENSGRDWTALPQGLYTHGTDTILELSASGAVFVAGFEDGHAAISKDLGSTWLALPQHLSSGSSSGVTALKAFGDIVIAGFGDGYASVSYDRGEIWEPLERGLSCGNVNVQINAFTVTPQDYAHNVKWTPNYTGWRAHAQIPKWNTADGTFSADLFVPEPDKDAVIIGGKVNGLDSPFLQIEKGRFVLNSFESVPVTFERNSTATYMDRGVLKTAQVNEPRFETDVDGTPLGILIEGTSTNLLINSQDFTDNTGSQYYRVLATPAEPIGDLPMFTLTDDGYGGFQFWRGREGISFKGDGFATGSVFVKQLDDFKGVWRFRTYSTDALGEGIVTLSMPFIFQKDGTLTISEINLPEGVSYEVKEYKDKLYRFCLTIPVVANGKGYFGFHVDKSEGCRILSSGFQLEELPFASSYIPTNGAAVTRESDRGVQLPLDTFSGARPWTITANYHSKITDKGPYKVFTALTREANAYYHIYRQPLPNRALEVRDGSEGVAISSILADDDTPKTIVATCSDQATKLYRDGVKSGGNITKALSSSIYQIYVGSGIYWGHIKDFRIWHHELTEEQVAQIGKDASKVPLPDFVMKLESNLNAYKSTTKQYLQEAVKGFQTLEFPITNNNIELDTIGAFTGGIEAFQGQISNLRLIDKTDQDNSRFYTGVVQSFVDPDGVDVAIPSSTVLEDEWSKSEDAWNNPSSVGNWSVNGRTLVRDGATGWEAITITKMGLDAGFYLLKYTLNGVCAVYEKGQGVNIPYPMQGKTEILLGVRQGGWISFDSDTASKIEIENIQLTKVTHGILSDFNKDQLYVPLLAKREVYAGDLTDGKTFIRGVDTENQAISKGNLPVEGSLDPVEIPNKSVLKAGLVEARKLEVASDTAMTYTTEQPDEIQHAFQYPNTFEVIKPSDPEHPDYREYGWTPNYNGINSYVEIPEWSTAGEFEIECDIYKGNDPVAYIFSGNGQGLYFNPTGTGWTYGGDKHLHIDEIPRGNLKYVLPEGFHRLRFTGNTILVKHLGAIARSGNITDCFKGQISNLKLIDKVNPENSRYYPGTIYSYVDPDATDVPMPATDILKDEFNSGKVVGGNITWDVTGQGSINSQGHIIFTGAGQAKSDFNMLKGKQYKITLSLSSGDTEIAYMSKGDSGGFAKFKNPIDVQWLNVTRDGELGINVKGACTLYKILIEETTDGIMFNFGNTQPWVPLLGDRGCYGDSLTNSVWKRGIIEGKGFISFGVAASRPRSAIPFNSMLSTEELNITRLLDEGGQSIATTGRGEEFQYAFQYPNTFKVIQPTDEDYKDYLPEVNTKWTPNFNGSNSYVEIPATVFNGDFEIVLDVYFGGTSHSAVLGYDSGSDLALYRYNTAKTLNSTIRSVDGTSSCGIVASPPEYPTGFHKVKVTRLGDTYYMYLDEEVIGTQENTTTKPVKAPNVVGSFGEKRLNLKGQISNLQLTDLDNPANSRYYPGVIYDYVDPDSEDVHMHTTTRFADWSPNKAHGTMVNFGAVQPYVPLLGKAEEYNSPYNRDPDLLRGVNSKSAQFRMVSTSFNRVSGSYSENSHLVAPINSMLMSAEVTAVVNTLDGSPSAIACETTFEPEQFQKAFQYPNTFKVIKPQTPEWFEHYGYTPVDTTFTRASTATYMDRGVLKTAAVDEPRFETDVDGKPLGVLIEGTSTNLISDSEGKVNPVISGRFPFGTASGYTLTKKHPNPNEQLSNSFSGSSEKVYTASLWIKAGTSDKAGIGIYSLDWTNQQMRILTGPGRVSEGVFQSLGNVTELSTTEWTHVQVTRFPGGNAPTSFIIYPDTSGSVTVGASVHVACLQLEELPFASSYIPTNGTAVTREADVLSFPTEPAWADNVSVTFRFDTLGWLEDKHDSRLFDMGSSGGYFLFASQRLRSGMQRFTYGDNKFIDLQDRPLSSQRATLKVGNRLPVFYLEDQRKEALSQSPAAPTLAPIATFNAKYSSSPSYGHVKDFRIWNQALTDEQVAVIEGDESELPKANFWLPLLTDTKAYTK